MAVNSIPVNKRTLPFSRAIQANGSYTLPQQGYIPPAGSRPLSGNGFVGDPIQGYAGNPGFINAAHVPSNLLPGVSLGGAVGVVTQTAQIQVNPQK
jgi:hypothetical protein